MTISERKQSLHEIEEILKSALDTSSHPGLSVGYFTSMVFSDDEDRGIHIVYRGDNKGLVEELLGLVDIPAMMNDLLVESVRRTPTEYHIFVYDGEKYHVDNVRKLNFISTGRIYP